MYLPTHYTCWVKQDFKIDISVNFLAHSMSPRAATSEIQIGKDVTFEIKLNKRSRSGITCNLRSASSGTRSVLKPPWSVSNLP